MKKHRKARLNLNQENVAAVNVREPALDIEELSHQGRPLPLPPNQEGAVPFDSSRGYGIDSGGLDNRQVLNNNAWRNVAGQSRSPTVLRMNPAYNSRPGHNGTEIDGNSWLGDGESYDYPRMAQSEGAVTDASGAYEN